MECNDVQIIANPQISKFQPVKQKSGEALYFGCCRSGVWLVLRHDDSSDVTLALEDAD